MKVAIIGAGMSGLTTAQQLNALGYTVDVYDKARGAGGRLTTKRLEWGRSDIGAQYFTVRDERFAEQVKQWQLAGVAAEWLFTPYAVNNGVLESSEDNQTRYIFTPSMGAFTSAFSSDIVPRFSTRIVALHKEMQHWYLSDDTGHSWGGYDWVVSTLPAEQSCSLFTRSSGNFDQVLAKIPAQVHQPCWALTLATTGWVEPEIQGIFGDDVVSWVSRQSAKPFLSAPEGAEDLWMLHFSAEWSKRFSKQQTPNAKDIVLQQGLEWFQRLLGKNLFVQHHHQHFWRFAKVAPHITENNERIGNLVDMEQRIAVIGDWCYGGRIEGAFCSASDLTTKFFS
ncbi:NAD(P)/FAD-dependent oxidoreductase [Flocculibacter collagenilyticus]|uniref:NAD(P)/FAD-dependent oxidoreductase n=1 Tax=Flocculibacter collagenilyticus TaxID=2744479 RepID=UPI0018F49B28|nr:NAD(P)-binding protein [Flocculibacter collagenilyticus]